MNYTLEEKEAFHSQLPKYVLERISLEIAGGYSGPGLIVTCPRKGCQRKITVELAWASKKLGHTRPCIWCFKTSTVPRLPPIKP